MQFPYAKAAAQLPGPDARNLFADTCRFDVPVSAIDRIAASAIERVRRMQEKQR